MFNGRVLLFSVKGSFIQSKNIPNKPISSTGYWMERWDCPAVHHKMKLGEASGYAVEVSDGIVEIDREQQVLRYHHTTTCDIHTIRLTGEN
jgi:hypothetical protein